MIIQTNIPGRGPVQRYISEIDYKIKRKRGMLKSWFIVSNPTGKEIPLEPVIKAYADIKIEEIKEVLYIKGVAYDKKCKDKKKLYQLYINS